MTREDRSLNPPRLLFWETTRACNLACRHCRAVPTPELSESDLDTRKAKRLIQSAAGLGVRIFVFSGGEPFLRPDLFSLVGFASETGMATAIASNGTLLDDEYAQACADAGVSRVSISLDGCEPALHDDFRGVAGAFERALRGIDALRRAGQAFQVNTTVTVHNRKSLDQMLTFAKELGAAALHLFLLVPVGCGAEIPPGQRIGPGDYEEVLSWVADRLASDDFEIRATCAPHLQRVLVQRRASARGPKGCLAGRGILFVSSDGTVKPCGYMNLEVDNIHNTPLGDIWRYNRHLRALRDDSLLKGRCGRCVFKKRCGGCRARALAAAGDYLAEEPMCSWGIANYP